MIMERVQKIFHLKGIYVNIRVASYGDFSLTLMTLNYVKFLPFWRFSLLIY